MPLLRRLRTIGAKAESVIGTAETLTATEGTYNAYDIDIQGEIEVEEREDPGSFNRRKGAPSARGGKMSFKVDCQWDGTATPPAWASVLFPACGWVNALGVFTPRSEVPGSDVKTLTLGTWVGDGTNAVLKTLAGAMGNFTGRFTSGKVIVIEFEFMGVWQSPPTDTTLIAPTYPTDDLLRYASATTTWQGVDQCVQEVTFSSGNTILLRECPDTAAGYKSAIITDRAPVITCDPEAELVATDDRYGDWVAGTEGAFSVAAGTTMTWSAPKAQIMNVQEGDREKLAIDTLTLNCNKNGATADEELSITFA